MRGRRSRTDFLELTFRELSETPTGAGQEGPHFAAPLWLLLEMKELLEGDAAICNKNELKEKFSLL